MKITKKMIIMLMILFLVSLFNISLATDEDVKPITSGDNYIGSYEEYEQLMNDTQEEYSQDELKAAYESYQDSLKAYYEEYKREETVKARVLVANEVETKYELDPYYYSVSKYKIQPITVQILEGEHEGEAFDLEYLITGDSLDNINYSEVKAGDTIFVGFYTDPTTGEVIADITNAGSNIERIGILVCIAVVVVILLIIYAGKTGLIISLIGFLILKFCLDVIPQMAYMGQGFIVGGILLILSLIYLITVMEFRTEESKNKILGALGFERKQLFAMGISLFLTIVSAILIIALNYMTRTVGAGFEVSAISENTILGNINFTEMFIVITTIISAVGITHVVCNAIKEIEKLPENSEFYDKLTATKKLLNSTILLVLVTIFTLYIPNHLLLLTNKYTTSEVWNSEILASELVRFFTIVIMLILAIPTTVALYRKTNKE